MKRNDQDLFRRLSVSLLGVGLALALHGMRPVFAGDEALVAKTDAMPGAAADGMPVKSSGGPTVKRESPSLILGGRIRHAPEYGEGSYGLSVPPLGGVEALEEVDCIAGCYLKSRLASFDPDVPHAAPVIDSATEPLPQEASPESAHEAPSPAGDGAASPRREPEWTRKPRATEARARPGGSGDWFRRINEDRSGAGGR